MSRDVAIVVGTVVGAYFGDASAGYAIGSLVGNAYDPVRIERQGPRLNDLKAQTASYGKMVPVAHGATRFAGNVIWATDVIETAHQQDSGGKGGGPVTSTTTYTYSISCAIALCEGVIGGIGRIWASGKLIYNNSSTADAATAANSLKNAPFRFYSGTETQTADSLIQAHVGAANTPAYRGVAYVVFENFQLADFGNRMPNFEFEAIETATVAHPAGTRTDHAVGSNPTSAAFDPVTNSIWVTNNISGTVSKINIATGARSDYPTVARPYGIAYDPSTHSMWVTNTSTGGNSVSKINISSGTMQTFSSGITPEGIAFDEVTNSIWVANNGSGTVTKFNPTDGSSTTYAVGSTPSGVAYDKTSKSIWVTNTGSNSVSKITPSSGARIDYPTGNSPAGIAYDPSTGSMWIANNVDATISKMDVATGARIDYGTFAGIVGVAYDSQTSSIWATCYGTNQLSKINPSDGTHVFYNTTVGPRHLAFETVTNSIWVPEADGNVSSFSTYDYGLLSTSPTVASVVSNICTRAGLLAGQIDVTTLTDTIDGYVVQRSTARAQIEELMQAFYFDAVESDGKVKFVKRGSAAALTITEDDLAAFLYGGTMPDNLQITRQQEMELPVEVNVQYMDEATSYQISSQRSQRLITNSVNKLALNFAISMTATKAKQVADVLMFDAWTARMQFAMAHGWKYSYLEPTDVIQVVKTGRTYNVRIIDEDASGGIYSRTAVMDDSNVYTQTATAAPPLSPGITVSAPALLDLVLMDIPLLRDQDDGIGFYAAACPYSGTWSGEQTFKSNDGGATWSQSGRAILNAGTIGTASTVLGNFSSGNIFDETNSVTVVMINGTLSGATELSVLNGSNVLLLGNEIIQFKNATLSATNTYILTGLLRGRQGTEWAMSTHVAGDRAVLLSSTTTYIFDSPSSEYNLARKYRGVSLGGFLDDALTVNFTNTGVAQECYSPVQLGGGRDAANNVTLNWTRRTRIGGAWNDYADVPLGEASEAYTVQIYSDATYTTLKRTITGITSPTTTYTAAQQTADGLTPGNPVYFIAYQVSATVGTGYGARGVAF